MASVALAAVAALFAAAWPGILARAATSGGPAFAIPRGRFCSSACSAASCS
ncbi:hypothetical protein ACFQFG_15120 [Methylobacterium persicinum]